MVVEHAAAVRLLAELGWANVDGMSVDKVTRLINRLHLTVSRELAKTVKEQRLLIECVRELFQGGTIELRGDAPVQPATQTIAGKPAREHPMEVWSQALGWASRQRAVTVADLIERFPISKREAREVLGLLLLGYTARDMGEEGICILRSC